MTRVHCEHCGREPTESLPANASLKRRDASCARAYGLDLECKAYADGRRAGLREALKLATDETIGPRELATRIRTALKAPKVSK